MKKISILLIEDNRLLREGISALLKKQTDMSVTTVGNGENILLLIGNLKPNIVLLDLGLRSQNSLQIVKLIKKEFPEVKIIIMDLVPIQEDVFDFVRAGAIGFMLKDISVTDFLKTIRTVFDGERILPPHLTGSLFSQIIEQALNKLAPNVIEESVMMSTRERQVIELIANGDTNNEIAQKLHLSIYTIKSHVHNILEKLALNTRVQIAKHAHLSKEYDTIMKTTSLPG